MKTITKLFVAAVALFGAATAVNAKQSKTPITMCLLTLKRSLNTT